MSQGALERILLRLDPNVERIRDSIDIATAMGIT